MSLLDRVREFFDNIVDCVTHATAVVKKGDTLWGIAKGILDNGTDTEIANLVNEIVALNPDIDPDVIHPGDEIKVPRAWAL